MAYWKPLTIKGQDVPLHHLEPFRFMLKPVASPQEFTIEVKFNNHCFSEAFSPHKHGVPLPFTHGDKPKLRAFDNLRYELSKKLPVIIHELSGKRIAQTKDGALVRVTFEDGVDYAIFFKLHKSNAKVCELFVISAYPLHAGKRNKIAATGEMKFDIAVCRVMQGKPPKFPPRQNRRF